jgi:hypothetical protein
MSCRRSAAPAPLRRRGRADRAEQAGMKVDLEPLSNGAFEVNAPRAHDAILLPARAGFDDPGELGHLLDPQARLGTFGPAVEQALRPRGVEAVNPVAKRLVVHAADFRRRAAIHAVPDGRQQAPKLLRRIVLVI